MLQYYRREGKPNFAHLFIKTKNNLSIDYFLVKKNV